MEARNFLLYDSTFLRSSLIRISLHQDLITREEDIRGEILLGGKCFILKSMLMSVNDYSLETMRR